MANIEKKATDVAMEEKDIKELKEMMAKKEKENDELRDMIKQLTDLVKLSNQKVAQPEKSNVDEIDNSLVYVTNNSVGKQLITTDSMGQTSIIIKPLEKNRPIERDYIKLAMQQNSMRRLFEYGILEFENEKFYKIYGIDKKFDMSEENVLKMFSPEEIDKTVSILIPLFRKPETDMLKHELCYKALDLVDKGQISSSETSTVNVSLNKIFCSGINITFNALISNLVYKRGEN